MTVSSVPNPPADERSPFIGDNVRYVEGSGELRVEDDTPVVPEFIESDLGWTRLHYAHFYPPSESQSVGASIVYGYTRKVRMSFTEDMHVVIVDVKFDNERDGLVWQRVSREEYADFETALERYIEVVKEGIVEVSLLG